MVKITLEFKSVDEAIVALGKIAGLKASAAPVEAPIKRTVTDSVPPSPAAAEPVKRERRPRADKGQKREPYGPRATEANVSVEAGTSEARSGSGETGAQAAVTDTGKTGDKPGHPTSTVPPVALASPEAVQAAVEKLFAEKGFDTALAVLSRYGVKRGKDLMPEQRAEFIAHAERVIAGGAV